MQKDGIRIGGDFEYGKRKVIVKMLASIKVREGKARRSSGIRSSEGHFGQGLPGTMVPSQTDPSSKPSIGIVRFSNYSY